MSDDTLTTEPTIDIAGRRIALRPVRVRDLPRFLCACEPLAADLAAGDIGAALLRHADALIEATCIGAGVERAWLDDQAPDALIDLAVAVLEVNADFFVRAVLPRLTAAAETLGRIAPLAQPPAGGTTGLPASSELASATTP